MLQIYLIRHGQTAWSLTGQHTGRADIPLTPTGQSQARALKSRLSLLSPTLVLTSPTQRAQSTCALAGFQNQAEIDPDLHEWDYGQYESLTTPQIHALNPTWQLFRDGCPAGESLADITSRADRLLSRLQPLTGTILLFSSGHFLRLLTTRWLNLPPTTAASLPLDPASLSILSQEHTHPTLQLWNEQVANSSPLGSGFTT